MLPLLYLFSLSQRILLCWVGPRLSSVLLGPLYVCVPSRALLGYLPPLVLCLRLSRFSTGTPKGRSHLWRSLILSLSFLLSRGILCSPRVLANLPCIKLLMLKMLVLILYCFYVFKHDRFPGESIVFIGKWFPSAVLLCQVRFFLGLLFLRGQLIWDSCLFILSEHFVLWRVWLLKVYKTQAWTRSPSWFVRHIIYWPWKSTWFIIFWVWLLFLSRRGGFPLVWPKLCGEFMLRLYHRSSSIFARVF